LLVRIEGALPAYISVEQYERNLARLAANRARAESPGAQREGPALLGGSVVCGICGHRVQVSYEASGLRAHLGEEYERYQRQRPARLSAAELAAIRALAGDIAALWAAPTTTVADRKRLIRAVIESVQVTADGATERVHATVTWAGGHQTHAGLTRPVARIDQLSYYPALTGRITVLARQGLGNTQIASRLAAEGFRTPRLNERFHDGEIQHLIRRLGLRPGLDHDHRTDTGSLGPGQWWLAALAREIGMPVATLSGWLRRGWVTGRQDTRPPSSSRRA
jgi:hypothetical protein